MFKYLYPVCLLILLSCSSESKKTNRSLSKVETEVLDPSTSNTDTLFYRDKPRTLTQVLCQFWENSADLAFARDFADPTDYEGNVRSFAFFEDGTVTKDFRGFVKAGKWFADELVKPAMITINYSDGSKEEYELRQADASHLRIKLKGSNESIDFVGDLIAFRKPELSPFHPINNAWRFAPSHKETDAALQSRIKAMLKMYDLYYAYIFQSKSKEADFIGMPTCFDFYAGGIYMIGREKLKKRWLNCFYNKEQAMQAYDIAAQLMDFKYQWPDHSHNWVQQNGAVIRQMYFKMDSLSKL